MALICVVLYDSIQVQRTHDGIINESLMISGSIFQTVMLGSNNYKNYDVI